MSETSARAFRAAREVLFANRNNYEGARRQFTWPQLDQFNWAIEWFDEVATQPAYAGQPALWIVEQDGREVRLTFAELSERSNQVANYFTKLGMVRGDRVILMLGNQVELWESLLAAMKLGLVVIPTSTLLGTADLADRVLRAQVRHVIARCDDVTKFAAIPGEYTRLAVRGPDGGAMPGGWFDLEGAYREDARLHPEGITLASDPLLLYFTSGTTAEPKLVEHTHASYPVGHLSTLYWIGLEPGDIHLNVSSPGWAKHAWSSFFAPWNAPACVFVHNYERFDAISLLSTMDRVGVSSFCAPPTVWRMLIQADLSVLKRPPAKVVGAGEPLNPEVIERVRKAWGVVIRDGFGQTETTAQIANPPGQEVRPGSMGRPLPGYEIVLLGPDGGPGEEGEICIDCTTRPLGLMTGYRDSPERTAQVMRDGYYHTGDVGSRDVDGYITYVGRTDDVFKASDYRISPFELESVLLEHRAVAEAAVVPAPDPIRLAVPKAYVVLAPGFEPDAATALSIFRFSRDRLSPYKRIRRLEFTDLPKTISGKIRRVELRQRQPMNEYTDAEFPELRS